jgi:hypothetical protein
MFEPYLAAMIWRLENRTDRDRYEADESAGRLAAAMYRPRPRSRSTSR